MAATKKSVKNLSSANEVDAFMQKLDHPLKAEIEAVRAIILGANPEISEGIKWNAPSFHCKEYFATINVRKDEILVILHLGAKVKDNAQTVLRSTIPAAC